MFSSEPDYAAAFKRHFPTMMVSMLGEDFLGRIHEMVELESAWTPEQVEVKKQLEAQIDKDRKNAIAHPQDKEAFATLVANYTSLFDGNRELALAMSGQTLLFAQASDLFTASSELAVIKNNAGRFADAGERMRSLQLECIKAEKGLKEGLMNWNGTDPADVPDLISTFKAQITDFISQEMGIESGKGITG